MTKRRIIPVGTLVLFGLFLAVMLGTWLLIRPPAIPDELEGVMRPPYRLLTPFELVDQDGQPFNRENFKGKWSMLFFGYLSCPDVCPMTLHELNGFWRLLRDETGVEPEDLQVVFVSVDPRRDEPRELGEYVAHFNPGFIGATAEQHQVDNLAHQFGAGYVFEEETSPGQYLVAHTSAIFLIDPLGRSVATFSQPHYASTLFSQFRRITDYFEDAAG